MWRGISAALSLLSAAATGRETAKLSHILNVAYAEKCARSLGGKADRGARSEGKIAKVYPFAAITAAGFSCPFAGDFSRN